MRPKSATCLRLIEAKFDGDRFRIDRRQLFLGLWLFAGERQLGMIEQGGEFGRQIGAGLAIFGGKVSPETLMRPE